ncbi:unnamed protein product [Discosporangium mesarthrocarpum]
MCNQLRGATLLLLMRLLLIVSLHISASVAFAPKWCITNSVLPHEHRHSSFPLQRRGLYSNQDGQPSGGWGKWSKEEKSQREFQDQVLEKRSIDADSGLRVRTGRSADMPAVSHLCIEAFRGPFEWWMTPIQIIQEFTFVGQLRARLGLIKRNEINHACIVAEDCKTQQVVGFLEIGMLPPPTRVEKAALSDLAAREEDRECSGPEPTGNADAPYLANVVVDKNQRRRGIGRLLVSSAFALVEELWKGEDYIYVTVEKGNNGAVSLYEGMGFKTAAIEDEMLARIRRRKSRIYLSKQVLRSTQ